MSLLDELKRRHVIRVVLAYLAASWLLIQVLETLLPIFDVAEAWMRIVVIMLGIGLIPVVILSWVFEITPQGIERDEDVAEKSPARIRSSRRLDVAIIAILTVAVVYFAADKFIFSSMDEEIAFDEVQARALAYSQSHPLNDTSIAVLPFVSNSDDPDQIYFADGLTEEILHSLASIDDLRVTSRTSSFAFRDREQPLPQIAAVLGVGHILDGSVRRSGDRIRIAAQLIDTRTDVQLWSDRYDRDLTVENLLDIQQEIAATVALALELEILPRESAALGSRRPANMEALDLYHDGVYYAYRTGPFHEDNELNALRAIEKLSAAIELDPEWAPAHAKLGYVYHASRDLGDDAENKLRLARESVDRALELDDAFAPAHGSDAYLLGLQGDYAAALAAYDRAISLGNTESHIGRAILMRVLARHDEAIDDFHAAAATDPLEDGIRFQLFQTYYCDGRYDDAIDGFTEFFPDDDSPYMLITLADAYARTGDAEKARELIDAFVAETSMEAPVASALALIGETDRARNAIETTDISAPFILLDIAPAAVILGNREYALELIERAVDFGVANFDASDLFAFRLRLQCRAEIRDLAGNPRYTAVLERLGLPL